MKAKYFFILLWIVSCGQNNHKTGQSSTTSSEQIPTLFELVSETQTNITFNNQVIETSLMNALNYDYMYNGSGVSTADFNVDGLPDLYFAANHLPNKLYLNKGDFTFEDITEISQTGGKQGFATGTTIVDINADGLPDIYVSRSGAFEDPDQRRNELFVNRGNNEKGIPIFEEEAAKYQLDLPHYSTQASFFDYDKDGDLDMFLINHNVDSEVHYDLERRRKQRVAEVSDRLFENQNGKFIDVSDRAGMINDGIGFGLGLAVGDINNDGWPDVIVGQDFASKDRIYVNQQDGTFKEVVDLATRHLSNYSMGNDVADINNDGWLDFISLDMVSEDNYGIKASMSGMNPEIFNQRIKAGYHHQYMYNTLQLNNGFPAETHVPYFSDIASLAHVTSTDWSWGPLFFDMDNDGDKDLFISNGIFRDFRNVDYIHYRERADAEYLQKTQKASPALKAVIKQQHESSLIQRMPPRKKENYFYENAGDLSFQKRNEQWITTDTLTASNGACYVDLDNDGDLDLITNNMDGLASIYKNKSRELGLGNYLKIHLNGPPQNRNGIGSRVKIQTENGIQIAEQYISRGFQSSVTNVLHFGLGKAEEIIALEVIWPDGKTQSLKPDAINQTITINYTDAQLNPPEPHKVSPIFKDQTTQANLRYFVSENDFDDFDRESLLPHKMSEEGPALAVGDINNDGLDDIFIGGAKGISGKLFLQQGNESFKEQRQLAISKDQDFEDVGATFFDAEGDGDLDLYVVSGGNEYEEDSPNHEDRLYLNDGTGNFSRASVSLPQISGSVVRSFDFDEDGDLDLFVGGRQVPGKYPFPANSYLLRNDSQADKVLFSDITSDFAPALRELGMVTDAQWVDINNDNQTDLVIVGEWMPITIFLNENGQFSPSPLLSQTTGWWYSIEAADFDADGDMDLVVGNLGLNSKYQASEEEPFEIFMKDFDGTGTYDIVLGYHQEGELFPLRGRECSSGQMPFIKEKFPDYHSFASANLTEVYGIENIETALHYQASTFATSYLENLGDGSFSIHPLPNAAQMSTVRSIISEDINGDEYLDLILLGNLYGFEVETPRQDGSYGLALLGDGKGGFSSLMPYESGLYVKGDVSGASSISLGANRKSVIIAKNKGSLQLVDR